MRLVVNVGVFLGNFSVAYYKMMASDQYTINASLVVTHCKFSGDLSVAHLVICNTEVDKRVVFNLLFQGKKVVIRVLISF
jgi:capsule polysaccharide export protein KpsE/RkpR